jgi:integrase
VERYQEGQGRVPSTSAEEGTAYSEQTVETMIQNLALEAAASDRYLADAAQIILALGIWAGLRPSEIIELKWEAVDLDLGTIRVRNSVVYGKERETTKTGKERIVYYLSPLAGHLRVWKAKTGNPTSGWVVRNSDDGPINLNTVSARVIGPNCAKHGIDWADNALASVKQKQPWSRAVPHSLLREPAGPLLRRSSRSGSSAPCHWGRSHSGQRGNVC